MPITVTSIGLASPAFLGTGLLFPMQLDASGARIAVSAGQLRIYQSIDTILNTNINERPYLLQNGVPFGTRIQEALFASVEVASQILSFEAARALALWEPRISVLNTDVTVMTLKDGGAALALDIQYNIRATNTPDNYVLPFRTSSPF